MTDLYGKDMLRTMPEEFNLATNMQRHDATSAEFLRTYQITEFRGSAFLHLLEVETRAHGLGKEAACMIPVRRPEQNHQNASIKSMPSLYGYRGEDPRIFYLSFWEFHMQWEPVRLQPPFFYKENPLTQWTKDGADLFRSSEPDEEVEYLPGEHYEPCTQLPDDGHEHIVLPRIGGPNAERMQAFRAEWILRRCLRPMVAVPRNTPMPHRHYSKEQRARVCNLYWRPWVLHAPWAKPEVPHLVHLTRVWRPVPADDSAEPPRLGRFALRRKTASMTSTEETHRVAWKHYIRGNVVSEQATQYIRNFLAACVAHVVVDEDDDDSPPGKGDKPIIPASTPMSVNQIHEAIKNLVRPGDEGDGATKQISIIPQQKQHNSTTRKHIKCIGKQYKIY